MLADDVRTGPVQRLWYLYVVCASKGKVTIDLDEYKDNCLDLPKYFDDGYLFI